MIKLSTLGKDLLDGVPKKNVKIFLETLLSEKEVSYLIENIDSDLELKIFIESIHRDPKLNFKERTLREISDMIYQNIFNILIF